jgi:hypothetical protein
MTDLPTLDDVAQMNVHMLAKLRDLDLEHLVDEARRNPGHVAADFVAQLHEDRLRTPNREWREAPNG